MHDQNLAHFIDLLQFESDPAKRQQLHKLLVEEEDRFGSLSERLNEADRLIVRCTGRLHEQEARVSRLREDGGDGAASEDLLAHMSQTLALIAQYRQMLVEGLDRTGL